MLRSTFLAALAAAPALAAAAEVPRRVGLAPLLAATVWVNGAVSARALRGRVVLVDVFTYECVNCVRVLPNLKRLYASYSRADLAIVGVHTPEVPSYQGRLAYVERRTTAAGIPWPVAVDDASRIWNAYGVSAWPTMLVFDRAGRLRSTIVGDGTDREVTAAVRAAMRNA